MKFELTKKQIEQKDNFYKKCKKKTKGVDVHLSYHFYPTGVGNGVIIRSETLNIEINITDYEDW